MGNGEGDKLAESIAILKDLIAFPTVSSDSNRAMIDYVANLLEDCGAAVMIDQSPCGTKANLFATLGPEVDGGPKNGIVLSGHSDVVPVADQAWSSDPFVLTERDGRLYGRGSCDLKGFIACALAMAPVFAKAVKDRLLHFALTYDEEVGCFGAQHLAQTLQSQGIKPGVVIIGEPTMMGVIEGHKGCYEYATHFHGLEGHGAAPDKGVNAVEVAVRYVSQLLELKEALKDRAPVDGPFDPPWTTINVGTMNGGTACNIIASKAQVEWEMRPVQDGDADFVKAALAAHCEEVLLPQMRAVYPGAEIDLVTTGEVAGLIPTDKNEARDIVCALTGSNDVGLVAFGTEAGIFQALGADAVVCGPGSIEQAHKADEFVAIEQMRACLAMLEGLGRSWVKSSKSAANPAGLASQRKSD